jgi:hypothetical protein
MNKYDVFNIFNNSNNGNLSLSNSHEIIKFDNKENFYNKKYSLCK